MKVMYYDNILISELMDGDHLEHHGVLGMKWGIRRYQSYSTVPRNSGKAGKETGLARKKSRLESKKASNEKKISSAKAELAKPRSVRDSAKSANYQAKYNRINAQYATRRADKKVAKGENPGTLGEIKLRQRDYYARQISNFSKRNDKLNAKIFDLEYRNMKLDKKIGKIDTKQKLYHEKRG